MNLDKFCLKWSQFELNLTSHFERLKQDGDFLDVTIACDGQTIQAHKVVLSACSPFLSNILKESACDHPIIVLQDISYFHLQSIITFMYTGQVYVPEDELQIFLKSAENLQIKGLSASGSDDSTLNMLPQSSSDSASTSIKRAHDTALEPSSGEIDAKRYKDLVKPEMYLPSLINQKRGNKLVTNEMNIIANNINTINTTFEVGESEYLSDGEICEKFSSSQFIQNEALSNTTTQPELDALSSDIRKRHSLDPRPCPHCNRIYSNLSNLRQHIRLIHNATCVTCKLCCKTYKSDLYLKRHLTSFHEMNLYDQHPRSEATTIQEKYEEQKRRLQQYQLKINEETKNIQEMGVRNFNELQ